MTATSIHAQRPARGEAPFGFEEIFFSRTDDRGVIRFGNQVFQRVSGHPWSRLVGAPHRLIRHPDMPKGFFHLFWDRLKADRMVSGYVKNLAADGLHYWVYALAVPMPDGGYISVRTKPSSALFGTVRVDYARLCKLEAEGGLSPADSAAWLLECLSEHGFADYDHFMAESLGQELGARDERLGRVPNPRGQRFSQVAEAVGEAFLNTNALCNTFNAIAALPHNMRILATRLEASGGPIAAISSNYGAISTEISDWVTQFILSDTSAFANLRQAVSRSRMLSAAARMLEEARGQFDTEPRQADESIDRANEQAMLLEISALYRTRANAFLATVEREAVIFGRGVWEMKRMIAGLSITRMMCKIESARLPERNASLIAIIDQLDTFQSELESRLDKIGDITSNVLSAAKSLDPRQSAVEKAVEVGKKA